MSLNSIELETVSCNLCGEDDLRFCYKKPDTRFFISNISFNVVQCRDCGLAFVNPRPTRDSIHIFYPDEFYQHRGLEHQFERYQKEATYLYHFKTGRALDIGCAGGAFLKVLEDRGWEVYGTDISDSGGNEYALDIRYGDLVDIQYPSGFFDAITAWAVFEHLHDPMKYFREVHRILKPGGHFVFLVTNFNSIHSRYAYREDIPRHLYFFSPPVVTRYAKETHFSLVDIHFSNDVYSGKGSSFFKVRLLRWAGVPWQVIFDQEKSPLLKLTDKFLSVIGVLLIPSRVETLLKRSGIMVVTFRKN